MRRGRQHVQAGKSQQAEMMRNASAGEDATATRRGFVISE
jgi:hypothetical protein